MGVFHDLPVDFRELFSMTAFVVTGQYISVHLLFAPKGGPGCLLSPPPAPSLPPPHVAWLSFDSILVSPHLLFCLSVLLFLFCHIAAYWPVLMTSPPPNSSLLFVKG